MMESYILARLEALMSRSTVSPYALARFFAVGMPFAALLNWEWFLKPQPLWLIQTLFVVCSLIFIVYHFDLSASAEKENARGFVNSNKAKVSYRYMVLMNLAGWIMVSHLSHEAAGLILFWALDAMAMYLSAIYWTPPPAKSNARGLCHV